MSEQGPADEAPKIQVDSDWKAEAAAEKAKLAEEAAAAEKEGGAGDIPAPDFKLLVSSMATQAMFAMGVVPDPQTGQRMVHMELARHNIDLLGVLEEKTKGNLNEEESQLMEQVLSELRMTYVQLSEHMAKQGASGASGGVVGADQPAAGGGGGGIIDPTA